MNDPAFKPAALILAGKTPLHLNQPVLPLVSWWVEGDNLYIHLADGRKIHAPFSDDLPSKSVVLKPVPVAHLPERAVPGKTAPVKVQAPPDPVTILPVHDLRRKSARKVPSRIK